MLCSEAITLRCVWTQRRKIAHPWAYCCVRARPRAVALLRPAVCQTHQAGKAFRRRSQRPAQRRGRRRTRLEKARPAPVRPASHYSRSTDRRFRTRTVWLRLGQAKTDGATCPGRERAVRSRSDLEPAEDLQQHLEGRLHATPFLRGVRQFERRTRHTDGLGESKSLQSNCTVATTDTAGSHATHR